MAQYIFLMHNDVDRDVASSDWGSYLEKLGSLGVQRGGSAIGSGLCMRRDGSARKISEHISGYIKIEVSDLDRARDLLIGNPVYEAGGTVEIRELPVTD